MSCEAHMCKVVELSLCANFLNTDPYTRVLKRWLVYAGNFSRGSRYYQTQLNADDVGVHPLGNSGCCS